MISQSGFTLLTDIALGELGRNWSLWGVRILLSAGGMVISRVLVLSSALKTPGSFDVVRALVGSISLATLDGIGRIRCI